MEVVVKKDYDEISKLAAKIIADAIRSRGKTVLGLPSGSTPVGTYKELIRLHKEEGLDWSKVITFNLDEYVGLGPNHDQSCYFFLWENLLKHVNIRKESIHAPNGTAKDVVAHCKCYEDEIAGAGGIHIQLLGIGSNGHIALNEPGSSLGSRTRFKTLARETIKDNARFFKTTEEVPKYAITMGIGTIMDARELILLANKETKADAILKTVEGPITAMVPATIVQMHPKATILVDRLAASKLTREYPAEPTVLKGK
ncbi:MAG: glucosamine-6-phosphate deaminase [Elusimicrobia bacterium RIFOXYB2_FULL_48_7]|nr:MAG: glucosamine-6-phosphate deaminase [Elusimicrobia bacterium RIFOXYB2_FULL_48_7]